MTRDWESELQSLIQDAAGRRLLLLEGKTDPPILFALLGITPPRDGTVGQVVVHGLQRESGRGRQTVESCVEFARSHDAEDRDYRSVFGIADGDGDALADLDAAFNGDGPLFRWPAYSIEGLLLKGGWPPAFGAEPDWRGVLDEHAGLIAANVTVRWINRQLEAGQIHRFLHASDTEKPKTPDAIRAAIRDAADTLPVLATFDDALVQFRQTLDDDVDEALCLMDGKWLIRLVARQTGKSYARCSTTWRNHVHKTGGVQQVREWWERVGFGELPAGTTI